MEEKGLSNKLSLDMDSLERNGWGPVSAGRVQSAAEGSQGADTQRA